MSVSQRPAQIILVCAVSIAIGWQLPTAPNGGSGATRSSVQLHFVIGLAVSGQFLMAVDGQIPIPKTANTRRRSLWPNDLDRRRRTAILAALRKGPAREQRSQISPTKRTPC